MEHYTIIKFEDYQELVAYALSVPTMVTSLIFEKAIINRSLLIFSDHIFEQYLFNCEYYFVYNNICKIIDFYFDNLDLYPCSRIAIRRLQELRQRIVDYNCVDRFHE